MIMRLLILAYLFFALPGLSIFLACDSGGLHAQPDRTGKDYALFFPVNNYQHAGYTPLENPIKDAERIATILRTRFGFATEILADGTEREIKDKLNDYTRKFADGTLPADGQLLIFFSGHGVIDANLGYFMPADGDPLQVDETGISYYVWQNKIDLINCHHILVAIDACFANMFLDTGTRGAIAGRGGEMSANEKFLENHAAKISRVFFSSDSKLETTPDNSKFAYSFLNGLQEFWRPEGYFTSSQLFTNYMENIEPAPNASYFGRDDPSSSFLFFHDEVNNGEPVARQTPEEAWETAQQRDDCEGYRRFLGRYPDGALAILAREKLKPCELQEQLEADWRDAARVNTCESYEAFMAQYPGSDYSAAAKIAWEEIDCSPKAIPGKMTFISYGKFKMGEEVVKPEYGALHVHEVSLSTFFLSATELTNREYVAYLNANGNQTQGGASWYQLDGQYAGIEKYGSVFRVTEGLEDHPVVNVTWYGAVSYCNWLSKKKGLKPFYTISGSTVTADWTSVGYRLPTEAEWEFAARSGGVQEEWAGTSSEEELLAFSNFMGSSDGFRRLAPIASFQANKLGLADMSGNVAEWCWDWYDENYYKSSPEKSPQGPANGTARTVRGGSWNHAKSFCRTTQRYSSKPSTATALIGFRLAQSKGNLRDLRPEMQGGRRTNGGDD